MKVVAVFLALVACGGSSASGPAWPRSAGHVEVDPEDDGGESLEPRRETSVAATSRDDDKRAMDLIEIDDRPPKTSLVETESAKPDTAKSTKRTSAADEPQIDVIEVKPEANSGEL